MKYVVLHNIYIVHRAFLFDFGFLVFCATFSNISALSWQPVLVVEEAVYPERITNHGQATGKLYHIPSPKTSFTEIVFPFDT